MVELIEKVLSQIYSDRYGLNVKVRAEHGSKS